MTESTLSLTYQQIAENVYDDFLGTGEVYGTGTIAIASGVVTLSSGTFPAWAADGVLEVGAAAYTVNTRDSGTQVTLDDLTVTVSSGAAYLLFHGELKEHRSFKQIVRDGLKLFQTAYKWRFLRPKAQLTLNAAYNTGTITVVDGVVTGASLTWPSWAASAELNIAGIGYTVNTRDSGTQLTLDDLTVDADALTTYTLEQVDYTLPDDWSGMEGKLTYRPGDGNFYKSPTMVSEGMVRELRSRNTRLRFRRPEYYAIRAAAHDATVGTRWLILFDAGVDQAYILEYTYRARQNDLTPTNKYPIGGPEHDLTVLAAIRKRAEHVLDNAPGIEAMAWIEQLAASKRLHDEETAPDSIGLLHGANGHDGIVYPFTGNVTFEGVTLVGQ